MKPHHKKTNAPNMEVIKNNQLLAVTLSPPDRRALNGSKMIQKNELETYKVLESNINEDIQYFKKLKYCKLEIFPELSKDGRVHYHGYIEILNVLKFYYHDLHLLNQISYEIDTLSEDAEGINKYIIYITKQVNHWKEYTEYSGTSFPLKIVK